MAERKIFAGPRLKRTRQGLSISQAQMARDLGISPSYLNLVERNQRPLTAQLLLKLADTYDLDLRELSGDSEERLASEITEVLSDPVFSVPLPTSAEILDVASSSPKFSAALLHLYQTYQRQINQEAPLNESLSERNRRLPDDKNRFPIEEVRDYFHARHNFIEELDLHAENLYDTLKQTDNLFTALRTHLIEKHGIRISILPLHAMPDTQRRFDHHNKRLFLSELLPLPSRIFQAGVMIAQQEQSQCITQLTEEAGFDTEDAKQLCRIGLANYFAGALMMPYGTFIESARSLRYDISILSARFGASIEQVAHRLSTLQRTNNRGVPFFLLRLDNAGNISKRFSADGFHFAKFGGTCPKWNVHDAFATPGQIIVQPVQLPDSTSYLTMSRTVDTINGPHPEPARKLAISLGCEIGYADQVVYGDGLQLDNPSALTPIGVTCRMCERHNCTSRAFPPMTQPLKIDANLKKLSAFEFH
ncbi:helix-turn-helix domain-containing protein [Terasakiella pusilla]|uniref:helix-turn-helix domain-containing protein n=1 Tax=Terasakiella pusilla TaxID=64973 RepID=UPI003AA8DAD4